MPICTYLSQSEVDNFAVNFAVTDPDVAEWKATAERVLGKKLVIEEQEITVKRFLRKPIVRKIYSLYFDLGRGEYQIINFCGYDDNWSINTNIDKTNMVNYLIGLVTGYENGLLTRKQQFAEQIQQMT